MAQEEEWEWGEHDVESFIAEYEPDEDAANCLRTQSAEIVQSVLSEGPLMGTNPSAILMSRIRTALSAAATDWQSFLSVVDEQARELFMAQGQEVMDAVMEEGSLVGNNPSAILMGRIRKAKQALGAGGGKAGTSKTTDAGHAKRRLAGAAGGGRAAAAGGGRVAGSTNFVSPGVVSQPKAQQKAQVRASDLSWPQGEALQHLASQLCQTNSAFWDFDVSQEDLIVKFKEALKARRIAAKAVAEVPVQEEWPEEWAEEQPADGAAEGAEPPTKKARRAAGDGAAAPPARDLSKDQIELRREDVLKEVLRLLNDAGGSTPLQSLGSKELGELRKGAVGNLAKFLASRPEVTTDSSSGIIMVSLA